MYVCGVITGPMGLQHSCFSDYPSRYILRQINELELELEIRQEPTLCIFNRMLGAHFPSPPPRRVPGMGVASVYYIYIAYKAETRLYWP